MFKINMACKEGFVSNVSVLKQYSTGGGKSGRNKARCFWFKNFTFLMCAWMFVNRFGFPFVQSHFWPWGFRFWIREVPENSESKDWTGARFESWRENSKIHKNSPRGEGLRPQFRAGSCAARNVQNNMACRNGFVSNGSVFKQYCSTGGGQSGWKKGGFFWFKNFRFLMCARMFVNRFQFPFVQSQFWSWGFRFWTRELPENSESKVWMSARFEPWRENSKILEFSLRGEGLKREFRAGSCAARNVQNQYGL